MRGISALAQIGVFTFLLILLSEVMSHPVGGVRKPAYHSGFRSLDVWRMVGGDHRPRRTAGNGDDWRIISCS